MNVSMLRAVWIACAVLCLIGCGSNPTSVSTGSTLDLAQAADDYTQLGINYLASGQRRQARFNILRALDIDARHPGANHAMALLSQSEGELEIAEKHFQLALDEQSDFAQARMNYASFLYLNERYRDANRQYAVVTQDVNYRLRPQAFTGLALTQIQLGDAESAEESLKRALQLNPRLGSAILEFAKLLTAQGAYVEAYEYLERYEALGNQSAEALALGIELANIFEEYQRAQSYALALISMYPDSRQARQYKLEQNGL